MMIRSVVLSMLASFKASQAAVRYLSADPAHGVTHVAPSLTATLSTPARLCDLLKKEPRCHWRNSVWRFPKGAVWHRCQRGTLRPWVISLFVRLPDALRLVLPMHAIQRLVEL
jgi:hypothetical protein